MRRRAAVPLVLALLAGGAASPATAGEANDGGGAYFENGGARIWYQECGKGRAVVLLHDGILDSSVWDAEWEPLCRQYHVVRYDRRGYGRSDAPKEPFLQTADLAALLRKLKIEKAAIVGCSSGSAIAIDFAIHFPAMAESLVLIGPVVHGMPSSDFFDARGRKNLEPLEKNDVDAAIENWAKDPYEISGPNPGARDRIRTVLKAHPQNLGYTGVFEIRYKSPAIERLAEIRAPTLLLVGEGDIPDVHAHAGAIQAGIWGSGREVVAGAAHLVPLEKGEDLVARIVKHLDDFRPVELPEAALAPLVGRYRVWGNPAEVAESAGRLVLHVPTEKEIPLFARSDTRFFTLLWGDTEFEFVRDRTGAVTGLDMRRNGAVEHCPRIDGPNTGPIIVPGR